MPGESLLRLGILLGACIGTVAVCVARRWHVPFPAASATAAAAIVVAASSARYRVLPARAVRLILGIAVGIVLVALS